MESAFVEWLIQAAVAPAVVALPVTWTGDALAGAAKRWFRRLRRTDDLSRLVAAATGGMVDLTRAEFREVRRLLEDRETWNLASQHTVEDLVNRIAKCLTLGNARAAEESHEAALAITRGLFEFAVADLDPGLFQQILMARLERMEIGQASALDKVLLDLHSDLAARFADVVKRLQQVLDRLPPGPAGKSEIVTYLRTLIDWVNIDPWPQDRRFKGPVLTPAAIERKLRVAIIGAVGEQDYSADDLTRNCSRLVVLGGPGSGKTWLAKRAVRRCAEAALEGLAAGKTIDEIELPLFTTCSQLFRANGDIRQAVVSSAFAGLGDLGGSRLATSVKLLFTERTGPTLLVIDALDEARGPDRRLRQADTLQTPWRIILTSRPNSWNHQLIVDTYSDSRRVGTLRPLRYPDDVEPFIESWFAGRPEWGRELAAQISRRQWLQEATTVPLFLAFYCIIGGSGPLPDFRRDLYDRVLRRILTGRWRGTDDNQPNVDSCLRTLQAWAWSAAASHPVSGIGMWTDEFPTENISLGEAEQNAIDHVATPLGPPDPDTGKTTRRFIHRSIREYLVARHVASLPADQATDVLLFHLWYDPDWEYSAPAALAMQPQRDQILTDMIHHSERSEPFREDLSATDAGVEFQRFLARTAAESSMDDWSAEVAATIGQSRVELARSGCVDDLGGAASWTTSNRLIRSILLNRMATSTDPREAVRSLGVAIRLGLTAYERLEALHALLSLTARQADAIRDPKLINGIVSACATAEDEFQAREALLGLLASQIDASKVSGLVGGIVQLEPTPQDKRRARMALLGLLASQTDASKIPGLVREIVQVKPTPQDKRQAQNAILGLLAKQTDASKITELIAGLSQLDPTSQNSHQVRAALVDFIAARSSSVTTPQLARAIAHFAETGEDKRQTREALLELLAGQTDARKVPGLVSGIVQLEPTPQDKRRARSALLGLLSGRTDLWGVERLVSALTQFDPTSEDQNRARGSLLAVLARQTDPSIVDRLLSEIVRLSPTAADKRQVRMRLMGLLADQTQAWGISKLVEGLARLGPTAREKRQIRITLLGRLASQTDVTDIEQLELTIVRLDPKPGEMHQTHEALLRRMASQRTSWWEAQRLAETVATLDLSPEERQQAQEILLELLPIEINGEGAVGLIGALVRLSQTPHEKRRAREALLELLVNQTSTFGPRWLIEGIVQLVPTPEDKRQARDVLLRLLGNPDNTWHIEALIGGLLQLALTPEDKRQACGVLIGLLARLTNTRDAARLLQSLLELDPTVRDISTWRAWAIPPTAEVIAVARRNSSLSDWLAARPIRSNFES